MTTSTAHATSTTRRTGYREVLANPVFRTLWVTGALAVAADGLRITTFSMLVFASTHSPLLGALAFGVGFAPQLLGSLLLGALADRGRPRALLMTGHLLAAAVALLIALLALPVALALALVAAVCALTPVFGAAGTRLVAAELDGDAYVLGRSLTNMASSGAQLVGLACAGAVVSLLGPRGALALSAAGYLAAALTVRLRLPAAAPAPAPAPTATATGGRLLSGSWHGARALLADRPVRVVLLAQWLPSGFAAGAEALVVPYTGQRGLPVGVAALLLGALPVGMLLGDLLVGRLLRPATRERSVAALTALLGLPLTAFALRPGAVTAALLLGASGLGFAYGLGLQARFLAALPTERQGQGFSLLSAGLMTVQGIGPVLAGAAAQGSSAAGAMSGAGLAVLLTAAWQRQALKGSTSARPKSG
ncbi:MFS transporter [Kitasatospora viridis]|uniref:Putative MFS family arabinose efflux permease n=1 Tax=Kitasatospora viridis TaxID=281105 RepID=A0A561UBM9_9ACTN|nr:MFS transporter [Kitasatospora viridis]TWF96764.1 putative MFS family arabinose efflux permease [Kitasatospora viridis]